MMWLLVAFAVILAADGLRMRRRLAALPVIAGLDPDEPRPAGGHFVLAPGVVLDEGSRAAVRVHAQRHGLEVVDIVPGDLPTLRALWLAQLVDVPGYRADRLVFGRGACQALWVSDDVAERAGLAQQPVGDGAAMARLTQKLKSYACTTKDLAVLPDLVATPEDLGNRRELTRAVFGNATPFVLCGQAVIFTLMAAGALLPETRSAGLAALLTFHLQPALALAGTPLRSRDLPLTVLLRFPLEVWLLVRAVVGRDPSRTITRDVADRRPVYCELLAGDRARFFEPRKETCPLCGSGALKRHLSTTDLLQFKPGRFTLERCRDCAHIFQNPGLSSAGLDFYYKDFYDGLGEESMEFIFAYNAAPYHARARMLEGRAIPKRWLDVGGGHGHFCCAARDVWPETRFDGLDLSDSIDEAVRRGWLDRGYRGLFPDLAASLRHSYDVVSMGHYLEHTLDPRAELVAAHTALVAGGHLLIEVPDPQSPLGWILGRYWVPWFQPQHQHLISARNLERMLADEGFTALTWHRGEAHQHVDFLFATLMFLDHLAPPANVPWRRSSTLRRCWRAVVYTIGAPLLLSARLVDLAIDPLIRRFGLSNTYRVLAVRD